jgi:hypothetical protein
MAFACAPALGACSLLLGEGFTDPDAERANAEAGGVGADSAIDGAGGGGNDGSTGADADAALGTDAAGSDADAGFVCPTATARLCDDFQRDEVQGSWDSVSLNSGGTLVIGKPAGASKRLESAVTALGGVAQLSKAFNAVPKKLHFEVTLDLASLAAVGGVYIMGVYMPNGSGAPTLLYVYTNNSGVYFVEQVADGVAYVGTPLPLSLASPHRIVIDVTFGGKVTATVDGTTKIDKQAASFLLPKPVTVILGAASIDDNGNGVAMKIDDFVFTAD